MTEVQTMLDVVRYIQSLDKTFYRATLKAIVATSVKARELAIQNAKKQFTGRNDRTLTGTLMNRIYSGTEDVGEKYPAIFAGVQNLPYGAIHEYGSGGLSGGVIKPVSAKYLWLPVYANAKKMTPREFFNKMKSNPKLYHMFPRMAALAVGPQVAGKKGSKKQQWLPLFYLVDKVTIPERPYLRPALKTSMESFPDYVEKFIREDS